MKTKYLLRLVLILFMAEFCSVISIHAQSPSFRIPIELKLDEYDANNVFKKSQGRDTIMFGVNPSATLCVDADTIRGFKDHWYYSLPNSGVVDRQTILEEEMPPPFNFFDCRIENYSRVPANRCISGSKANIHNYSDPAQRDSFSLKVYFDDKSGAPIYKVTLRWPSVLSEYAVAETLQYLDDDLIANVKIDMLKDTTLTFRVYNAGKEIIIRMNGPKVSPPIPDTITAVAPPVGDLSQPVDMILQWNTTPNALYYRLNVSDSANFRHMVIDTIISGTSFNLTKLKSVTYYYWRVYSATKYGLSFFQNPPFYFRTKPLTPAPTRLYPDSNAINVGLTPQFRWSKITSLSPLTYQIQIASDTSFAGLSLLKDTTLTDTTISIGPFQNCSKYYWRMMATNADGPSSWSTKWVFRTVLITPNTPTLSSPLDNAQNISTSPILSWTGDVCSDSYRLIVARDSLFTRSIFNMTMNQNSRALSNLDQDSTYYWKVKSLNAADSSSYTAYRSFTTILLPAAIPQLVSPAAGDTTQDPITTIRWRKSAYTSFYHLQLSIDPNFGSYVINDSTLTDTSQITPSLLNCTNYYWKVRAINRNGSAGFSSSRNFKIKTAIPGAPVLLLPPNGKDSLLESVTLSWIASDVCTKSYYYHLSTNSSFTDTVRNGFTTSTSVLISGLRGNLYYYWHVKAIDYLGESVFSETRQFHTIRSRPDTVYLISPANNLGGLPSCVTFKWDSAAFADSYRLQIAFDSAFTSVYFNDSTIIRQLGVQPTRQVCGLLNSRTFYWRVRAKNDIGYSNWSAVRKFVTLYPPDVPNLIEPVKDTTGVSLTPLFVWGLLDRTDAYQLQVGKDTILSLNLLVYNDTTITQSSWRLVYPLDGYTKYYWRVRGKNSAGWGGWSEVYPFTTTRIGVGKWLVPLTVAETGPEKMTIYYGVNPEATQGIDPGVGEYELPPPAMGYFDARFVSPFIGQGLLIDYHEFTTYTQVDTFEFTYQPGMGSYPMMISWPASRVKLVCDSMIITDRFVGATIRVRMDIDSVISVNNSTINSLYIISHGAYPVVDVKPITPPVPKGYVLYQNYPNPFNPSTKVIFSTDHTAKIKITIYDVLGREVTTLANSSFAQGVYIFEWNGLNSGGVQMPSGVYYVRMVATGTTENLNDQFVSTKKMLMMK